jgi:hypothetical protein
MHCPNKLAILIASAFLLPVVAVLGMNYETISQRMEPRPENGYMIYITSPR